MERFIQSEYNKVQINMISKVDIIKLVRHLKKRGSGIPDHRLIHPMRDWLWGLGITSIIFVVSSVYTAYFFLARSKTIDDEVHFQSSVATYDREGALEVLEKYQKRTNLFNELRNDKSNVVFNRPVVSAEENIENDDEALSEILAE